MKWVATAREFDEMISRIREMRSIAIDTEADSLHSYFDKVCLVQITSDGDDWIVDPLAGFPLGALGEILSDGRWVKVLHGADYDLRILNRDFGFTMSNIRDTMICAQLLGYEAYGLAALLGRHFGVEVDKSHQRADWSARPLTQAMLRYAAMDTHYLHDLVERLEQELRAMGRWEWAEEEFERLAAIRFVEPEPNPEAHLKLKGAKGLSRRQLAILQRLVAWRDGVARGQDRPPFKVMSNDTLLGIATIMPETARDLKAIRGMSSAQMARYKEPVLAILDEVRRLDESALPELAQRKPWKRDKAVERRLEKLRKVRDEIAAELRIEPGLIAPRHVLSVIAAEEPKGLDELASIPAMRRWQIAVAGPRLLGALG
jgi:ribonuclease D